MKILGIILIVVLAFFIWKRSQVLALVAKVSYQRGQTEKAFKFFKVASKIGRLSAGDMMFYGYILLRAGELELSHEVLTRASLNASKTPMKRRIKSILALVIWKEGDLDTAIEMMEDVMEDFKSTNTYQNLGLMYVLKGDGKKALEFNLKAHEYNSDDLVIMDNLAESYAISGDIEKAKEIYLKLLEKEPGFPEPYYSYGMILAGEGKKEEGLELMKKSLSKRFSFLSVKDKAEVEALIARIESKN